MKSRVSGKRKSAAGTESYRSRGCQGRSRSERLQGSREEIKGKSKRRRGRARPRAFANHGREFCSSTYLEKDGS